jgi:MFS family permease
VWPALEQLIDPVTRGDPESPLRWTCKITHTLSAEMLALHGISLCDKTVAKLLWGCTRDLQAEAIRIHGAIVEVDRVHRACREPSTVLPRSMDLGRPLRRNSRRLRALTRPASPPMLRRMTSAVSASTPWHTEVTRAHWRVLSASFLGWIFDGYEAYALVVALPSALRTLLTAEQLKIPTVYAGTAVGATLLGWGIGGLVGGTVADYIGRKRVMIYSVLLYAAFSGFTALSQSFLALVALRLLTGMAMGSEWSTGVAMVAETWPNRARAKGAGFLMSGFGWGTLLASLVWWMVSRWNPLGDQSWRVMFVIGALPALFTVYIRRAMSESESWLKAVRERRWAATEVEREVSAAARGRPFTMAEIFREPESRRRTLLAFVLSLSSAVGWWAISAWLPAHVQAIAASEGRAQPDRWAAIASILYTAGAVAGYVSSGFIIDAIGRRKTLVLTYAGALLVTPVTYFWVTSAQTMLLVVVLNGFFTLGLAFSWLAIYPPELFTPSVRSTAASVIFNGARIIAWVFPIMAGTLIQRFGGIPLAAMTIAVIYVPGLVVPWFLPESKDKPLPE